MIAELRKYGQKKRKHGAVPMKVLAVMTIPNHVIIGNGHQKGQNFVLKILNVEILKFVMVVCRGHAPVKMDNRSFVQWTVVCIANLHNTIAKQGNYGQKKRKHGVVLMRVLAAK